MKSATTKLKSTSSSKAGVSSPQSKAGEVLQSQELASIQKMLQTSLILFDLVFP